MIAIAPNRGRENSIEVLPGFAAIVEGVDAARPTSTAVAAVGAALVDHPVVVLRDQRLSAEQQITFARQFGPLHVNVVATKAYTPHVRAEVLEVSNLADGDALQAADDTRRLLDIGNMLWHSDASYETVPCHLSMLYAVKVPAAGGETQFADLRAGYDSLPSPWKRAVEGLVAVHSPMHARIMLGFEYQAEQRARLSAQVSHPIVRTLPESGRKSLYLSAHASHVVGMSVPEGRMMLQELTEMAVVPDHVYTHAWRAGDLVIWDNLCTLHRLRRYDSMKEPRLLRRVSTIYPGHA